jgi:hypothetical protein
MGADSSQVEVEVAPAPSITAQISKLLLRLKLSQAPWREVGEFSAFTIASRVWERTKSLISSATRDGSGVTRPAENSKKAASSSVASPVG